MEEDSQCEFHTVLLLYIKMQILMFGGDDDGHDDKWLMIVLMIWVTTMMMMTIMMIFWIKRIGESFVGITIIDDDDKWLTIAMVI